MRLSPLVLCALASACASASAAPTPPPATAAAPTSAVDALEQRLMAAHSFRVHARLATSGRIQSRFEGDVAVGAGSQARLAFQGSFGNRDADVLFTCDGKRMRTRGPAPLDMDAAPALREGLVVDFVRRGLTHDAARLATGKVPDDLDGSVRTHLEVVGAAHLPGEDVRGHGTEQWTWALYVDHQHAADETLWLDARSGLPLRRHVVVHFPEGDMDVDEEYDDFAVDVPIPDSTFRIDP